MSIQPDSDSGGYVSPNDDDEDTSQVADFFRGKCVFITGVTGFVGKVLLEKLLRSCSQVRTVYVLLRSKEGVPPRQRLDELLTCQIFAKIRSENPSILTKVVPVSGDISQPSLGMSQSDINVLVKDVSVVFHSAATVRFDEPLNKSIQLNVCGAQRVLELCKKLTHLSALVHVSTAYSFCNRREIDEIVYQEKVPPHKIIDIAEWMDDSLQEAILPKLMDGRPTTYHYSKALAENLLVSERGDLPVAIVRPSIVTAAFKEPMPGWVDGMNGPSTFIVMTGRGLLRTMLVYEGTVVDWIPVDLLANVLLTSAWHIGTQRPSGVKVFNCTSGTLNKVTWSDVERTAYPLIIKHPSLKILRYPGGSFKSSPLLNTLSIKLQHTFPARIIDALAFIFGFKTEFGSMAQRMERAAGYLQYFTTREWTFRSNNFRQLRELQSLRDRKEFDIDIRQIEWTPYLESYVLGVRKYILREDDSTLPAARTKIRRLYYAELLGEVSFVLGILYLLLKKTNLSQHLLWSLISLSFRIMERLPNSWVRYLNSAILSRMN